MKDRLEEFIKENREGFDAEIPRSDLWSSIESKLEKKENHFDFSWLWKVAALVFLASTIALLFKGNLVDEEPSENELSSNGYNSELVEVENYYTQLISDKKQEILSYDINNPELLNDINGLDSMYSELKSNLKVNQEDDRLISAMIMNLQLRVDILNKQLNILKNIKEIERNEKINI
ncbi:hypothetical protein [Reichenbachiella sp. MALMAid0571]|uniref:hypothetical protein n=1 Tax=Reichenbachiella sp. MALMAid0571 TaxID=3143939 RepID=UPI0032DFA187